MDFWRKLECAELSATWPTGGCEDAVEDEDGAERGTIVAREWDVDADEKEEGFVGEDWHRGGKADIFVGSGDESCVDVQLLRAV